MGVLAQESKHDHTNYTARTANHNRRLGVRIQATIQINEINQQCKSMRSSRQSQRASPREDPGDNTLKQTITTGDLAIAMGLTRKENQEWELALDDDDILIRGSSSRTIPGRRPSHQTEHGETGPGGDALHVVLQCMVGRTGMGFLVTSTPTKMAAVSRMHRRQSTRKPSGSWSRCRCM